MKAICIICGVEFEKNAPNQKCCSKKCSAIRNNETKKKLAKTDKYKIKKNIYRRSKRGIEVASKSTKNYREKNKIKIDNYRKTENYIKKKRLWQKKFRESEKGKNWYENYRKTEKYKMYKHKQYLEYKKNNNFKEKRMLYDIMYRKTIKGKKTRQKYNKKKSENLLDGYILNTLRLKKSDAPKELIEAKREQIKLLRLIKQMS